MDFEGILTGVRVDPLTGEMRYEAKLRLGGVDTGVTGTVVIDARDPSYSTDRATSAQARLLRVMVTEYVERQRDSSRRIAALEERLERLESLGSLRAAAAAQFIPRGAL